MKHSRKNPQILILPSDLPKLPKMLPRPLSPEVDLKLIEYLTQSDAINDKCLLLMRYTGLRLSDLLNLEFNPVFTDNNGHSFIRGISCKFDKQYIIPTDEKTVAIISILQKYARESVEQKDSQSPPSHLVNDPKGRVMGYLLRSHLNAISPLVSDVPITPHQLRHTFATSMINAGMGLYSVMKLLGHMDMRMTLRYAELYPVTLHKEFQSAIKNLTDKYEISGEASLLKTEFNPIRALDDINQWLRSTIKTNDKKLLNTMKRLSRLKTEVEDLLSPETPSNRTFSANLSRIIDGYIESIKVAIASNSKPKIKNKVSSEYRSGAKASGSYTGCF